MGMCGAQEQSLQIFCGLENEGWLNVAHVFLNPPELSPDWTVSFLARRGLIEEVFSV